MLFRSRRTLKKETKRTYSLRMSTNWQLLATSKNSFGDWVCSRTGKSKTQESRLNKNVDRLEGLRPLLEAYTIGHIAWEVLSRGTVPLASAKRILTATPQAILGMDDWLVELGSMGTPSITNPKHLQLSKNRSPLSPAFSRDPQTF